MNEETNQKNNQETENIRNLGQYKNNYISGTHLDIFGSDFRTEISPMKYYIHKYDDIPYSYMVYTTINQKKFVNALTEKYGLTKENFILKFEFSKDKKFSKVDWTHSGYMVLLKEKIVVEIHSYKVAFFYSADIPFEEIQEVVKLIKDNKKKKRYNKKFFMIATSNQQEYGFELKKYSVKHQSVEIAENYNDDFVEVDKVIFEFLKANKKNGLILLHGKYGTGKTTYLRHIMTKINRRFIFLPVNLMDAISSPNFLPFISRYKDSVLILEDCEDLLVPRSQKNGNSSSLANLLNLGDGLLSDALSLKIICTFNTELKNIDQAILRKGRLVARYEFKELETEKAQKISERLGQERKITKPMTLADIYNDSPKDFVTILKKKIGF